MRRIIVIVLQQKLNLNIYKLDENILSELPFSSFITCVEVYTSDLKWNESKFLICNVKYIYF